MEMVVSHWSANAAALVVVAAVVGAHLLGMRTAAAQAKRDGHSSSAVSARRAIVFYLGVLTALMALVSPVGYWAQRHIWVRSLQDLLLVEVAPALIVLGAPWLALARGLMPWRAQQGGSGYETGREASQATMDRGGPRPARSWSDWPSRPRVWLTWPMAITVGLNAAWWGWHMPLLYDAALRSSAVYAAEVVMYLGLGVAFWLQLIESEPVVPKFAPVRRVILMLGTVAASTVLAMVLAFGSDLLYPAYLGADHRLAAALADQQLGGAVLWVLALPPFVVTAVGLLTRWLHQEESEAIAAGLNRLLKPPTSAWPSRPGL